MTAYIAGQYTGGLPTATAFNAELKKIEDAFDTVLNRLGQTANQMETLLDMNDHPIINVATDDSPTSLMTREGVEALVGTGVNVGALQADLTTLEIQVDSLFNAVVLLQGDMADQQNTTTRIDNDLTALQTSTTAVQGDIATMQSDIVNLQTGLTNLTNTAFTNETNITGLTANVNSLSADVSALQTSMSTLVATVGTMQMTIAQNENDIDNLQASIAGLNQNIIDTITDVQTNSNNIATNSLGIQANLDDINILKNHPVGFSFSGSLPDNTVVANYVSTSSYTLRGTNGSAATGVNRGRTDTPSTSNNAVFNILLDGTAVGTVIFGANQFIATYNITSDVSLVPGSVLSLETAGQLELESPSITLVLEELL